MNIIVLGENNPMLVEYYTYKVEFQDRGAGHVHGTLWLKLERMERLIRNDTGDLILRDVDDDAKVKKPLEDEDQAKNIKRPFKGISSALKKLKNNEELNKKEK